MEDRKEGRSACPVCWRMLDVQTLAWGQEDHAFPCKGCGARLTKKNRFIPVMTLGGIMIFLGGRFVLPPGSVLWVLLGWVIALFLIGLQTTRVWVAGDEVPDAPAVREGPPPLSPRFRGMSAPPPEAPPSTASTQGAAPTAEPTSKTDSR
jgi:hypothetical protein